MSERPYIGDKVELYVELHFKRSGRTSWVTVRQVARALKARQRDVEDAVEGHDNLMLTSFMGFRREPLGDHFVETYNPLT